MFRGEDFLMGQIRKIQKHKEERDRSGQFKNTRRKGTDQENFKTQGGKGQIRKIQKNKKERMEERKRRDCYNIAWSTQDQQMQC
jgi:hypothetical protein